MKIIKNNIIFIIIILIGIFIFKFELPYYIEAPGGLTNISDRYKIANEYNGKGSFNLTYVSEYKANIPMYLYSLLNKDYDIVKKEDELPENSTYSEEKLRGRLMYKDSINNAVIASYKEANKEVKIIKRTPTVIYRDKDAKTNLRVGDQIIKIDDTTITSRDDINNFLKNNTKEKITIGVINNNIKYVRNATLNNNKIGILIIEDKEIEEDPEIKITTKSDEYGPSGGLMISLEIYNKLTEYDLTKGFVISGTGTIDEDGNVGSIDGIKYKLKGAVNNKADIFLVPSGNYKEAIKLKKKNNYKIKIIKVNTLEEAIQKIKEI